MNEQTTWSPTLTRVTPGPDLLDDARALVAQHHRQPSLQVAVSDVHVGVAQTGVRVADEDLTLPGAVEVELLDLDASLPASYTTAALVFIWSSSGRSGVAVACVSVKPRCRGRRTCPDGQVRPTRRSVRRWHERSTAGEAGRHGAPTWTALDSYLRPMSRV